MAGLHSRPLAPRPSRLDVSVCAAGRVGAPRPMDRPPANAYPDLPTLAFQTLTAPLQRLTESLTGPGDGVRAVNFADSAPSWEALEDLKTARRSELGAPEPDTAAGPPLARSRERTFGKAGPIRVKLYRDHAAWCPYCQKVWMLLEEKQVPYRVETTPLESYGEKPASFLTVAPKGYVPAMEIDGEVVEGSDEIVARLEKEFPERRMVPEEGTPEWVRAQELKGLENRVVSVIQWAPKPIFLRDELKLKFEAGLDGVEDELGKMGGPYFLGARLSFTDINFVPFMDRWAAFFAYFKGVRVRTSGRWPRISAWFDAMETHPSYVASKCDYYACTRLLSMLLPRNAGSFLITKDALAADIDGRDGASWSLPLPPLGPDSTEPYSPGEDPPVDRLEAAARLIDNRDAVLMFALRGVGQKGEKQYSAPLADPDASPGLEWRADVDAALRHVAHALLVGVEQKQASGEALGPAREKGGCDGAAAVYCAEYVRDRVSVPRDLLLPQARQLRAHLNWLIDTLQA
ncbi:unnamed protein product [Ostreobium quekettii]|uniref:GST N-terminal domain-containing protein n=1 Tax=Ostreobium quekettii TaxID=121088 RepID=A0A8S1J9A7_9CHLO|nr:unnamed protein product [Ostreobium quekettii]|eukprot:evm.model.scf_658EXC.1 EVM.evm.TU.scf_658EXC.1   scf_658EXC:3226-4776(-)